MEIDADPYRGIQEAAVASFTDERLRGVLGNITCIPDAIAVGGWHGSTSNRSGYEGRKKGTGVEMRLPDRSLANPYTVPARHSATVAF